MRHRGTWTADDRARTPYRYLPVDVPAHANGLHVRLSYDRSAGVLDLGCEAPRAFRGWSGGAREEFAITRDVATPGYLAGELEAGTWHVVLGLHRIPPGGLEYEVVAQVYAGAATVRPQPERVDPPRPHRPPPRELPSVGGLVWRAGDFHSHTVHSDGALTVPELACLAAERGLDFLAVTDHNTVSHHAELGAAGRRAGIQLLAGQEVTTGFGHANAFGDISWVDFRQPATAWLDAVEAEGGLLSVNHPLGGDCSWRHELPRRAPLAEVWHSSWLDYRGWGGPLAWWRAWDQGVVPIGGSDWHSDPGAPPGSPTTWVACEGDDVLGGLRAGRVAISADRGGPLLLRLGDELVALGAEGALLTDPDGRRRVVHGDLATFPAAPGPHWLEDHNTAVLAISG